MNFKKVFYITIKTMPKINFNIKKRYILPLSILALIFIFRLFLPSIVKNYVNKVLADIPGYYGQIDDIDLAIYRGAYVIKGMYLNKVNSTSQIPFLKLPQTDISIDWRGLFKGKIVSKITLLDSEVSYVTEDQATTDSSATDDWTDALNDLVPIDINKLEIKNGSLIFYEFQAEPKIDLRLEKLDLTADNLRLVKTVNGTLPSTIKASAISFGNGKMSIEGNVNVIKNIPDVDLSFSLQNANAVALNDFTRHYARFDFERGDFEVYSEMAIADGYLKGYVKPLLKDSKLISKREKATNVLWEGFIDVTTFLLKNQKTNTLAMKIPLEGDLNDVSTNVWATIGSIFKNAWVKAFKNEVDNDISFKDAVKNKVKNTFSKKENNK